MPKIYFGYRGAKFGPEFDSKGNPSFRGRWAVPEKKEDQRTQEARRRIKAYYDRFPIVTFENMNFQGARFKIGHRCGPFYDLVPPDYMQRVRDPDQAAHYLSLSIEESQVIPFEPVTNEKSI